MKFKSIILISLLAYSSTSIASSQIEKQDYSVQLEKLLADRFSTPTEQWRFLDSPSHDSDWPLELLNDHEKYLFAFESDPNEITTCYAIIYLDSKNNTTILSSDNGLSSISELISRKYSSFPDAPSERLRIIKYVKNLRLMPEGRIASKDFSVRSDIDDWLIPKKSDRRLFESFCSDPTIATNPKDNAWSTSFYYFNIQGGVDKITIKGQIDTFSIDEFTIEPVAEVGTFNYVFYI